MLFRLCLSLEFLLSARYFDNVFGQPFVKRFALCYRTVVCLSCLSALSVTFVYCGQMVGWIKMLLSLEVGLLSPGDIVLDGDPASPKRGHSIPPTAAHVCSGQTAGWIKMPLRMEVGVGLGNIVLDGDPILPKIATAPQFLAHVCCGQRAGWIKMPLGTEVGLDPGDIVLDGDPAPHTQTCLLWPNGRQSRQLLSCCKKTSISCR